MTSFDFITDEEFRTSLEKDYREMNLCIQNAAFKAAVVLAGSIIEAVLIDYVIAENFIAREEALKLDFGRVLTLCKDRKIITDKTSDLSSVIKSYRNLIHPGRSIRLNETVDKETAEVSKALVNIILNEIEKQKKENYGYTAEQIISKIGKDSNSLSILEILIKSTNQKELERLMMKHLPEAYLSESSFEEESWYASERQHIKPILITCFRKCFDYADENLKKKTATWFAKIIKEESDNVISSYGIAFLRSSDMKHMNKNDAIIVKSHIFGQIKNNVNETIIEALSGIGSYTTKEDINTFIDPLVRAVCQGNIQEQLENSIVSFLVVESLENFSKETKELILKRLEVWKNTFNKKGQHMYIEKVERLIGAVDLPF
ncbi:MAG: hypothetical protein IH588_18975 [Anaerolineales bacterium]|nr:hypothetical protein [Anaerolineales bacterium]